MNSILQDLFYGNLCPHISVRDISQEYEPFLQILREQAPALERQFNLTMSNVNQVYIDDTQEMFCRGFGLAVNLLFCALSYGAWL